MLYCTADALITHTHALECAFEKAPTEGHAPSADRLRVIQHLLMLSKTGVQGLAYAAAPVEWKVTAHSEHKARVQAIKIQECYSADAKHCSHMMVYDASHRNYNKRQRH